MNIDKKAKALIEKMESRGFVLHSWEQKRGSTIVTFVGNHEDGDEMCEYEVNWRGAKRVSTRPSQ